MFLKKIFKRKRKTPIYLIMQFHRSNDHFFQMVKEMAMETTNDEVDGFITPTSIYTKQNTLD